MASRAPFFSARALLQFSSSFLILVVLFLPTSTHAKYYNVKAFIRNSLPFLPPSSNYLYNTIELDNDDVRDDANANVAADEPFRLDAIPAAAINSITERQSSVAAKFRSSGPIIANREIALTDGAASEPMFFVFKPTKGKSFNDYSFSFKISNEQCLVPADIAIDSVQLTNNDSYNVTATIDFSRWVGTTDIQIVATEKVPGGETIVSESTSCIVVGMVFYRTDANGNMTIVGGQYPLNLTMEEVAKKNEIALDVFIQYPDGTDSTEGLNPKYPMDGITIVAKDVTDEISHKTDGCPDTGNTYDGSAVQLSDGCAYGFSENKVNAKYVGPKFGLKLNKDKNGTFSLLYDWPGLVKDSWIESDGYGTSLDVSISGSTTTTKEIVDISSIPMFKDKPPTITKITPTGPFTSSGTETFTCYIEGLPRNLTLLNSWTYKFEITFANKSVGLCEAVTDGISFGDISTNTTLVNFKLPPGAGENLSWKFSIAITTGETFIVQDKTDPKFTFDLMPLTITSMTPDMVSESGGTEVVVTGQFYGFDYTKTEHGIYFDGVRIDSGLITSANQTHIVFKAPAKSDLSSSKSEYDVTVKIDTTESNVYKFRYAQKGPSVVGIAPQGPFGTTGTEQFTVSLQDVTASITELQVWKYEFKIKFTNGTVGLAKLVPDADGISTADGNLTNVKFTLPSGSGENLSWDFSVTLPTGDTLVVADDTVPKFTFDLVPLTITSITPDVVVDIGGSEVVIQGSFPSFDSTNLQHGIYFENMRIDTSLIVTSNATHIIFKAPAKADLPVKTGNAASEYDVTVRIDSEQSNTYKFRYTITEPSVTTISPLGPFGTTGTDQFTCTLKDVTTTNITQLKLWKYEFKIIFANGTEGLCTLVSDGISIVDGDDNRKLTKVKFTLPPGSGENLDWNFAILTPAGDLLAVGDLTAPKFTFDLVPLTITSLTPNAVADTGGVDIVIDGKFPGFDSANAQHGIYFDSYKIDKAAIVSSNGTRITFKAPPKSSLAGGKFVYNVTVQVEGEKSNAVEFRYKMKQPVVTEISPMGPFGTAGTDSFSCKMDYITASIVQLQAWSYQFGIIFANGTVGYCRISKGDIRIIPTNSGGNTSDAKNSTALSDYQSAEFKFTLPPGNGENLAWNFTVSLPSGESFSVGDNTVPKYRFNLVPLTIDSMTPSIVADLGGAEVVLNGKFPGFNTTNSEHGIYLGSVKLDKDRILSYNASQIKFTVPPRSEFGDGAFSYNVTVRTPIETSNKMLLTYVEKSPVVSQITPEGPFGSDGTDSFRCVLKYVTTNLTALKEWQYTFGIIFKNGTVGYAKPDNQNMLLLGNNSAALNFTLPVGFGWNLPWNMSIRRPIAKPNSNSNKTDNDVSKGATNDKNSTVTAAQGRGAETWGTIIVGDETKPPYRFDLAAGYGTGAHDNFRGIHWTVITVLSTLAIILLMVSAIGLFVYIIGNAIQAGAAPPPGVVASPIVTYVDRDNYGRAAGDVLPDALPEGATSPANNMAADDGINAENYNNNNNDSYSDLRVDADGT